jgi:hypothetical protein
MKIYHHLPKWSCPNKLKARVDSILTPYRVNFNQSALPEAKQYWSLCGKCFDDDHSLLLGCEPEQMVSEGLITPNQFHGVEISKEIHDGNSKITNGCNWYNNDFYSQLAISDGEDRFNPGIVNVDMLLMPENGAFYFSKIMNLLSRFDDVMLIGNFILKWRWRIASTEDIIGELQNHPQFQSAMATGKWRFENTVYFYKGSGRKVSYFGTVIFYNKK